MHSSNQQIECCLFIVEVQVFIFILSLSFVFVYQAAKQLIDKRLMEADNEAAGSDEQDEPDPSCDPQITTVHFVTWYALSPSLFKQA